jgi:hypothetical protein
LPNTNTKGPDQSINSDLGLDLTHVTHRLSLVALTPIITAVGGHLSQRWQLDLPPNLMYWEQDFLLNFEELKDFFFSKRKRFAYHCI